MISKEGARGFGCVDRFAIRGGGEGGIKDDSGDLWLGDDVVIFETEEDWGGLRMGRVKLERFVRFFSGNVK